MANAVTYCTTRRELEERGWFLTSRLSSLTARLMRLIGRDPQAFVDVRNECRDTRQEITVSHRELRDHRRAHGC